MTISSIDFLILAIVFLIIFVIAWALTSFMRISFELILIFSISQLITIIMASIIHINELLHLMMVSGFPLLFMLYLAIRFNQLVADPYNGIIEKQEQQISHHNFTFVEGEKKQYDGEMNNLYSSFNTSTKFLNKLIFTIRENEHIINSSSKDLYYLSKEISSDIERSIDDIDKIIQTVVLLDDALQTMVEDIQEIASEFHLKYTDLKSSLDNADRISDQTNLIAVNAAIEAAHSKDKDENFGIVADAIQQLSGRSRKTTDKMLKEANQISKQTSSRLTSLELKSQSMEDVIIQVAELANEASSFVHKQSEYATKLEKLAKIIEEKSVEAYEEVIKFTL